MAGQNNPIFAQIREAAQAMQDELRQLRRDLHRNPELGWMEMRTSALIAQKLREYGCDQVLTGNRVCDAASRMGVPAQEVLEAHYQQVLADCADWEYLPDTRGGMTGVVGILHCGEGPVIALRFDIDALPITEAASDAHYPAQCGFRSRFDGVMHACGHDGHTTTGLGTAKLLCSLRNQLHGTVRFIFQPAEEGVRGAKSIVANGHLEDVQYLLGAHMGGDASAEACIGVGTGRSLATAKYDVIFHGKTAHAGFAPEMGNNAMLAAATAVLNLHAIPRVGSAPTRVNVGKLVAGTGRNVICDRACLELEVRGMTGEANDYMADYAKRIIAAAAQMHGCTYELKLQGEARGNCNCPELSARVADTCRNKLGLPVQLLPDTPGECGSEDYSFMSERVHSLGGESCYFMNISACAGPIHNEHFDFREEALVNGVIAFAGTAADLMISD